MICAGLASVQEIPAFYDYVYVEGPEAVAGGGELGR